MRLVEAHRFAMVSLLLGAACLATRAYAAPHGALEIKVADDGHVNAVAHLTLDDSKGFSVVYVLLPFSLRASGIDTNPSTLFASTDTSNGSSLLVLFVPPRTTSLDVIAAPSEIIKPVDPVRRELELTFENPDPPRGLDGVLQQPNVVFRFDQVLVSLPENASEVQESKPASHEGLYKRRYLLTKDDDSLAISWRGTPSHSAIVGDCIANGMLGMFMGVGIGIALYNYSRIRLGIIVAFFAFVATLVRLYQAAGKVSFPWNDGLPSAATFLGIFLALGGAIGLMKYHPHKPSPEPKPTPVQVSQEQTNPE